jgi:hypothetical protein
MKITSLRDLQSTVAAHHPQAALPLACGYEDYVPSGLAEHGCGCLNQTL